MTTASRRCRGTERVTGSGINRRDVIKAAAAGADLALTDAGRVAARESQARHGPLVTTEQAPDVVVAGFKGERENERRAGTE